MNPNEERNEAAAPNCEFCGEPIQDFAKVGKYGCANCCAGSIYDEDSGEWTTGKPYPTTDVESDSEEKADPTVEAIVAVPKLIVQRVIVDKSNRDFVTIQAEIKQTSFGIGSGATLFEQAIGEGGELFVDRMKGGARESAK